MRRIAQRLRNTSRRWRFRSDRSEDGATAVVTRSDLSDAHDTFRPDSRFRAVAWRAPLGDAWRSHRPCTHRAIPRPPSCRGSSETISRPSVPRPRRCVTAKASRALWNRSFATSSGAAVWPAASPAFGARPAGSIDSSPSRVRAAGSVRGAAAAAWRNARHISSTTSFPTCQSVSGCLACRIGCGTRWRGS